MNNYLDVNKLSVMVRSKRAGRGLREVADEIGEVSPSTLSRVENGKMPDMTTFLRICNWLEVSPAQLIIDADAIQNEGQDTSDTISILLRADKNLDPATANALATLIKAAYRDLPKRQNN